MYWAPIELIIPVLVIELTTDCATGPSHFGVSILFKWTLNSVFALFDCSGAILYELLIAGLMDPVYRYLMHIRPPQGLW